MSEIKEDFYVFGYGSLVINKFIDLLAFMYFILTFKVWKNNDFEFESKVPGYVKGFKRRFYQNSIDHRGTADYPGRVVTLIKSTDIDRVYGMGYKIASSKVAAVLEHLDFREKNGYERFETLFYPIENVDEPKKTIVYVADATNPSWNHDHDLPSIASQVYNAVGPSGPNILYVYNLCDAMRENFPKHYNEDSHLFELERLLKEMEVKNVHGL